jgi:hypothetical protein
MPVPIHRTSITIKRPLLESVQAEIARRDAIGLPGDFSSIVSEALVRYLQEPVAEEQSPYEAGRPPTLAPRHPRNPLKLPPKKSP